MEFREILKLKREKGQLILGESAGGEKLLINIKETPSIIITGETGSGKSILLDQILLELISDYTSLEMELALIDTSGVELNYYCDTNYLKYKAINDIDKSVVTLSRILEEIEKRKKLIKDTEKMLSGIISQLAGLNIIFLLVTSDVHNKFFETDKNVFASLLISFDYTNSEESEKNNIDGSNNLEIGAFLAQINGETAKYHNFDFEDNIIKEVLHQYE